MTGINDASIAPTEVLDAAKDLASEEGENTEYDRALVELTATLLGHSSDDNYVIARAIGIKGKSLDQFI